MERLRDGGEGAVGAPADWAVARLVGGRVAFAVGAVELAGIAGGEEWLVRAPERTAADLNIRAREVVRELTLVPAEMQPAVPDETEDVDAVRNDGRDDDVTFEAFVIGVRAAELAGASVLTLFPAAVVNAVFLVRGTVHDLVNGDDGHAHEPASVVVLCPLDVDGLSTAPDLFRVAFGVPHSAVEDVRAGLPAFGALARLSLEDAVVGGWVGQEGMGIGASKAGQNEQAEGG